MTESSPAAPSAPTTPTAPAPTSDAPASPSTPATVPSGSEPIGGTPDASISMQPAAPTAGLFDLLGEDLAKEKTFEKFKDGSVADLGKSYLELQKQMGQPKVGVPPADADDATKAEFYKQLGVPETTEGYGFAKPENMPDGMEYNEEDAKKWAEFFKENNIPADMANTIRDQYMTQMFEMHGAQAEAQTAAATALDESFTKEFGENKQQAVQQVKDVLTKAIPDEATRQNMEQALSNEALLALAMVDRHYKKEYGQSDTLTNDPASPASGNVDNMRDEARKMMSSDAYRDTMHKDHKAVKNRVDQMYRDIGALTKTG